MTLDRLWAGWRAEYVTASVSGVPAEQGGEAAEADPCVLCRVLAESSQAIWRGEHAAVVLNAYPYTSGHVMAMPVRHVASPEDLNGPESTELWATITDSIRAIKTAYRPHGLNVGANLGRAGGAGVPGHLHMHVVPRWDGDTNFMTAVAESRVLPESLDVSLARLRASWPLQ